LPEIGGGGQGGGQPGQVKNFGSGGGTIYVELRLSDTVIDCFYIISTVKINMYILIYNIIYI